MAFINPSNLYSGGQVKFDASPYIRLAEQRKAKREAAELATDKYFSDMLSKIDPNAARPQDAPYLNELFGKLQGTWINNKGSINKGGLERMAFMQDYNTIHQAASESKKQGQLSQRIADAGSKGLYQKNKYDLEILAKMELPINDPNRYKDPALRIPYTEQDLKGFAKPWTAKDQSQLFSTVTQGAKPQLSTDPNDIRKIGGTDEIEATLKYTPDQVKQFALSAGEFAVKNPSKFLDVSKLAEDASVLARYDKVIEQTFGKEFSIIKDDGSAEELKDEELIKRLAMAETAENMLNFRSTIKETDRTAQRDYGRELQAARLLQQRTQNELNRRSRRENAIIMSGAGQQTEQEVHPFDKDISKVKIMSKTRLPTPLNKFVQLDRDGYVQGGVVYYSDGTKANIGDGYEVVAKTEDVDVRVPGWLKAAGYGETGSAVTRFKAKDGVIEAVITTRGAADRSIVAKSETTKAATKPAKGSAQKVNSVPSPKPKAKGKYDPKK